MRLPEEPTLFNSVFPSCLSVKSTFHQRFHTSFVTFGSTCLIASDAIVNNVSLLNFHCENIGMLLHINPILPASLWNDLLSPNH